MKKLLVFVVVLSFLFSPVSFAASKSIWELAQSEGYGEKSGGMLGRGLLNASTCFVDILVQTVDGTKQGPPLLGTLTGLGGGIGCTALRATSGVLDISTFWVPGFNGFPVSKSYNNCLCTDGSCDTVVEAAPIQYTPVPEPAAPKYVAPEAEAPVAAAPSPMKYVKK